MSSQQWDGTSPSDSRIRLSKLYFTYRPQATTHAVGSASLNATSPDDRAPLILEPRVKPVLIQEQEDTQPACH